MILLHHKIVFYTYPSYIELEKGRTGRPAAPRRVKK